MNKGTHIHTRTHTRRQTDIRTDRHIDIIKESKFREILTLTCCKTTSSDAAPVITSGCILRVLQSSSESSDVSGRTNDCLKLSTWQKERKKGREI